MADKAQAAASSANDAIASNKQVGQLNEFLSVGYKESLFGCFSDINGCLLSCCCACIPMATLKANLDNREVTIIDCLCCPNPYQMRQTLRSRYSLGYAPFSDAISVACCMCCALHQDVREYGARAGKPPQFFMKL